MNEEECITEHKLCTGGATPGDGSQCANSRLRVAPCIKHPDDSKEGTRQRGMHSAHGFSRSCPACTQHPAGIQQAHYHQ
jgi:hypothetical protein